MVFESGWEVDGPLPGEQKIWSCHYLAHLSLFDFPLLLLTQAVYERKDAVASAMGSAYTRKSQNYSMR